MDWNREISQRLLLFHQGAIEEYRKLLNPFNLYVYGYGYKTDLLKEIFPDSIIVDFSEKDNVLISRDIYSHYNITPSECDLKPTLSDINQHIKRDKVEKVLILINARKDILEHITNFRVVLVQNRDLYISFDELLQYNFIMRDLTTFVFEVDKRPGLSSRIEEVFNIYDCVGPLSKTVFRLVLRRAASKAEFSLRDLFNKEKKKLLIVNYGTFRESLAGFFDAGILVETNNICRLNISKKDLSEILDIIDKTE
ncbi:origin recognition complex subunit 2 [Nematocida homosporus]|uniref:origin recognition complex subunit 2 n=1 Tax=Nematocida homosporus TaxID=1912981 RepID=UPI002220E559|nr:origin recognition complex subunit 2 [Nematocida homosporus]KAI5184365.1 origin recognition complex subunit 2 [Nematocida homosporus]